MYDTFKKAVSPAVAVNLFFWVDARLAVATAAAETKVRLPNLPLPHFNSDLTKLTSFETLDDIAGFAGRMPRF